MHPYIEQIHKELINDINEMVNNYHMNKKYVNHELSSKIAKILYDYIERRKVYDFKINLNYPDCEIYIQYHKTGEIILIQPIRFERLKKLQKLNETTYTNIENQKI